MKNPVRERSEGELSDLFSREGIVTERLVRPFDLEKGSVVRVVTEFEQHLFEANGKGTFTMYRAGQKAEHFVIVHPLRVGDLLQMNLGYQYVVQKIEMVEGELTPA